jgi:hypothetical protein
LGRHRIFSPSVFIASAGMAVAVGGSSVGAAVAVGALVGVAVAGKAVAVAVAGSVGSGAEVGGTVAVGSAAALWQALSSTVNSRSTTAGAQQIRRREGVVGERFMDLVRFENGM